MTRALTLLALVGAAAVPAAHADVGFLRVSPTSARPGDVARVWAAPGMPIYLVPRAAAPRPFPCNVVEGEVVAVPPGTPGAGICRQYAARPPNRPPYVLLGRARGARSPNLRFRVPDVRAGSYRFVMYCAACYDGPGGSLIPSRFLFRVRA